MNGKIIDILNNIELNKFEQAINRALPLGVNWSPNVYKNLFPKQIIYNEPTTICVFPDGEKVVVKCGEGEKYVKEVGVMACIVKKLYGNRSEFLRDVDAGYDQKEAKKNKG